MINPFLGYMDKMKVVHKDKYSPVRELVRFFHKLRGTDAMHPGFYHGRFSYGKLAKEAKELYEACENNLDDAIWALDKMNYLATKGKFDWSISTCLKHKLYEK